MTLLSERIIAGVERRSEHDALLRAIGVCESRAESLEETYDWAAASEATKCANAIRRLAGMTEIPLTEEAA